MAVKRRRLKRKQKAMLNRKAVKIMCKYCMLYKTCNQPRIKKEKDESEGIITRCIFSPITRPRYASWEKVNKKGEVININKNGIPLNKWFFGEDIKVKKNYNSNRIRTDSAKK